MRWLSKDIVLSASLLAGTIIGAGVFSLPFVFSQLGIVWASVYMILFCGVATISHLLYADVVYQDSSAHRFSGFIESYIGKKAYALSLLTSVVQMIFSLTIYLVLSVSFVRLVVPVVSPTQAIIAFWLLGSFAIFWKMRRELIAEFLSTLGIFAVIALVGVWGVATFPWDAISFALPDIAMILVPFGALLFSFSGRAAIPPLVRSMRDAGHSIASLRWSIVAGTVLPLIVYLIFVVGVVGISSSISEDAVSGLVGVVPDWMMVAVGFLGLLSLWSSYFVIGLDVKDSLSYDVGFSRVGSGVLVVAIPLALFFLGFQDFIGLVVAVGGLFGGIEGLFIIRMWRSMKRRSAMSDDCIVCPFPWVLIAVGVVYVVSIGYVAWRLFFL